MQHQNPQIETFRELLGRFLMVAAIDDAEISVAYAFLFSRQQDQLPVNHNLAAITQYLSEVMAMYQLHTLEDLVHHYDELKKKMRSFLQFLSSPTTFAQPASLSAKALFTSAAPDNPARDNKASPAVPPENADRRPPSFLQQLTSTLYAAYAADKTAAIYDPCCGTGGFQVYLQQEVTLKDITRGHQPRFSKAYLEQFCEPGSGRCYIISMGAPAGSGKSRSAVQKLYMRDHKTTLTRYVHNYFSAVIERDYWQMFAAMRREEPIFDRQIKAKLAEWLYYSKFRNASYIQLFLRDPHRLRDWGFEPDELQHKHYDAVQLHQQLMAVIRKVYETKLSLKKWVILKSPPGCSWFTSDNPGFSINLLPPGGKKQAPVPDPLLEISNIKSNTVVYYPLSKDYCLRLQPYDAYDAPIDSLKQMPIIFEQASVTELNVVNRLTCSTPHQLVVTGDRKVMEGERCAV
jgi:hypothetical protein